ncbi:MAG: hypothetical protein GX161_15375 [Firmicutes bacterium]|nr:hypothetical protein [Bacillota bacterium]
MPEPPIDWDGDEWLWDEFVQTMRRLTVDTDGDGVPERYGLQTSGWGGGANHIGLWGQYWVNEDVTEWNGDRPEVIAALEKTVGLRTVDKVIGGNLVNGTADGRPRRGEPRLRDQRGVGVRHGRSPDRRDRNEVGAVAVWYPWHG